MVSTTTVWHLASVSSPCLTCREVRRRLLPLLCSSPYTGNTLCSAFNITTPSNSIQANVYVLTEQKKVIFQFQPFLFILFFHSKFLSIFQSWKYGQTWLSGNFEILYYGCHRKVNDFNEDLWKSLKSHLLKHYIIFVQTQSIIFKNFHLNLYNYVK